MPAEWIKPLLDAFKLGPLQLAVIGGMCAVLLLGPLQLLQAFGVAQLAQDHRQWIGLALLGCAFGLLAHAGRWAGRRWRQRNAQRRVRQYMLQMTEDERDVISGYVVQNTRTQRLRFDDGVVRGLEAAGVIYRVGTLGGLVEGFAYNLTPTAWKVLHEQHLVGRQMDER